MRVLFTIALRNLVQARRRTALLSTAIGLVTMMLVLLIGMSQGIQDNLVKSATLMSAGHVNVGGFFKQTAGSVAPIVTHKDEIRQIVQENVPNLDYMVDRNRGWGKLIGPTGSTVNSGLSGIDVAAESRFFDVIQPAYEDEYKDGGEHVIKGDPRRLSEPNTILIFVNQAKRLEVGVGDVLTIQTETVTGRSNTADVTVVAVAHDVGLLSSFASYVPKQVVFDLYQLNPDTTGAVWVYLTDIDDADDTMKHLREVFAAKGYRVMDHEAAPFFMKFEGVQGEDWTGQKIDLTTWKDEVQFLTWVITAFNTITLGLVAVLLVIIVVGIMNTMWNTVRERTREVGTMRAIGMTRLKVGLLFMTEAVLLGLFATTAGAIGGAIVAFGIDAAHIGVPIDAMKAILLSDTIHLVVRVPPMVVSIGVLTSVTALASLYPSIRAALMRPVTALAHAD
jgi:putative ABC transport system permease protein